METDRYILISIHLYICSIVLLVDLGIVITLK